MHQPTHHHPYGHDPLKEGIRVDGVRASPGGRRTLRFGTAGYTTDPRPVVKVLDRVFSAWPMSTAFVVMVLSAIGWAVGDPGTALHAFVPVFQGGVVGGLAYLMAGLFYHQGGEILGEIAAYALMGVLLWLLMAGLLAWLLLLPFPSARRGLKAWWKKRWPDKEDGSRRKWRKRAAGEMVPYSKVASGSLTYDRRGGTMVTLWFKDGSHIVYAAWGESGQHLAGAFHRALGVRLRTAL
ncbi:hypothetical protein [Nocardiopsis chromatogenes]|uniref:hypothetical protein n=1 Tax=Nocardiopsis chromatogenes TaxID=280239 RepID=UPI00034670F6|nr:hypothetical protein [Nocardiopsis chromatogenes]